jgi:hypothetical protein
VTIPDPMTLALLKAAGSGLSGIADAVGKGPGRFALLVHAFAPTSVVSWFEGHRLRVRQVKAQETIFNEICAAVEATTKARATRYMKSPDRLKSPMVRAELNELQGDMRLLATIREAVRKCEDVPLQVAMNGAAADPAVTHTASAGRALAAPTKSKRRAHAFAEDSSSKEDASWWDVFEMLARRSNEEWRRDLLARALLENDRQAGAISLKSIWEIGMMEADDFGCLAAFCDSALHIDGKPAILLEPDEQARFKYEFEDDHREMVLAHGISALIDAGLVSKASTQFDTDEPVELQHLSGPTWFSHAPQDNAGSSRHRIQIEAYFVNDVGLDICRLYEPKLNIASDASFNEFRERLTHAAEDQPELGKVSFRKRRPSGRAKKV